MGIEYKIKVAIPAHYDPSALFKKLPSPIHRATMREIYNYSIGEDGFYFVDHLVSNEVASLAFRLFVDEALGLAGSIEIVEP